MVFLALHAAGAAGDDALARFRYRLGAVFAVAQAGAVGEVGELAGEGFFALALFQFLGAVVEISHGVFCWQWMMLLICAAQTSSAARCCCQLSASWALVIGASAGRVQAVTAGQRWISSGRGGWAGGVEQAGNRVRDSSASPGDSGRRGMDGGLQFRRGGGVLTG
jgi:hypothetical protein